MSKDKNVQMSHEGVGSSRKRRTKRSQLNEQNIEKAQKVIQNTDDLFAKLEQEKITAEAQEAEASIPRLASFKDLVFLGRMDSEVKVGGWTFTINTLTGQEQRELLAKIMTLPPDERLIYAKPYTVWMSLESINKTPLEVAASAAGYEDVLEFICSWQDPLIERLYNEYEKLFSSSKEIFKPETIEGDLKK